VLWASCTVSYGGCTSSWRGRWTIILDAHGHGVGSHAAHGPEGAHVLTPHANSDERLGDIEKAKYFGNAQASSVGDHGSAQLIGIAILEFGVLFHSILIGLTLAVTAAEEFTILFVVLVFHQTFEGLGLGSRLAFAPLPPKYKWAPYVAAIVYGVSTPIGIAVGLGVRNTYAPESATASIVSGVLDSLSAGILIYTALVEVSEVEMNTCGPGG
jgi:zinc transporter 1/2/3